MDELPPIHISELKQGIITDEIMEYSDIKTLQGLVFKLQKDTNDALEQFKEVILPLIDELLRLSGDHMLTIYKADVINFVNKNPKVIVDNLILKCYDEKDGILRAKIVKGDESFFLQNTFDDMTDGDSKIINIIFKFKDFWGKLNDENKEILKSYLLSLIALCDIRYLNFKKYLCLKKINPQHAKLFLETDKFF